MKTSLTQNRDETGDHWAGLCDPATPTGTEAERRSVFPRISASVFEYSRHYQHLLLLSADSRQQDDLKDSEEIFLF